MQLIRLNTIQMTRRLLALTIVAGGLGLAICQTSNPSEDPVQAILQTGLIDGHYLKEIGPMGDAAAVKVTKILAGRTLSKADIDNVLVVLGSAFANPTMVKDISDREPRTALLVLQYLASSTNDPDLEKRIAQRKQYVTERYAKSLQDSSQK